jgi:uncharacterized protein with beta-barrel porin domain
VYGKLTATQLTQASGEIATGSQQATFDAMNLFMGVLTDPFAAGRDTPAASPHADQNAANAYASITRPRDALAPFPRAQVATAYEPHWSAWGAGFGGSQTTGGNAAVGSNTATSAVYGSAAGADYHFSPNTIAGFALAGGGTSFNVVNGGTGRSDLFQAGGFIRHSADDAYVVAALAYGWQDITSNRTMSAAGFDQLQARFDANALSGRLEGGYRYSTPWMGVTPYAAGQFTTLMLPVHGEQAIIGANTFALNYGASQSTDPTSELGVRTDRSLALGSEILTLRSRLAWVHDYNPDRFSGATFQALPGASFIVDGARQASDAALTSASAEIKWTNGFSLAATFEGEFSQVTNAYAGKGVVRYEW